MSGVPSFAVGDRVEFLPRNFVGAIPGKRGRVTAVDGPYVEVRPDRGALDRNFWRIHAAEAVYQGAPILCRCREVRRLPAWVVV